MSDSKILGLILLVIGVFGFIGTIGFAELFKSHLDKAIVDNWLGMSLCSDFIFTFAGLGLVLKRNKQ